MNLYLERYITKKFKEKATAGWQTDYEYKSKVMLTDAESLLNNLSYHLTYCSANQDFIDNSMDYILSQYSIFHLKEAIRIHNAKVHRVTRLKRRIESICSERAYFLTLTFTDDVLSRTDEKTRRKYVSRSLKSISSDYVANIDYGSKNEREHYHAVVRADYIDYHFWSYGIMYAEVISSNDDSFLLLSKYVSKLTNHAIKETCKRKAIIYSKKY